MMQKITVLAVLLSNLAIGQEIQLRANKNTDAFVHRIASSIDVKEGECALKDRNGKEKPMEFVALSLNQSDEITKVDTEYIVTKMSDKLGLTSIKDEIISKDIIQSTSLGDTYKFEKVEEANYLLVNTELATESETTDLVNVLKSKDYSDFIYPERVEIGDSWTVENKMLANFLGYDFHTGTCTFTLIKSYDNAGEKMAQILFNLDAKSTDFGPNATKIDSEMIVSGKITRSLTYGIDKSTSASGYVTLSYQDKEYHNGKEVLVKGKANLKVTQRIFIEK